MAPDPYSARQAWEKEYENIYSAQFDRACIMQSVCRHLYPEIKRGCAIGLKWDHFYDTGIHENKEEFLNKVEQAIKDAVDEAYPLYNHRRLGSNDL